jgi:orotate phosphoribosyltransferase
VKDYQQSFLNLAINAKALEFGEFKLKSGRLSPYFFNAANMLNGCNLYELAKCYVDAINDKNLDFDCIYGPAYKGIFLGSIVATLFSEQGENYPLSFNRKEEKDHGEGGNIIGANPKGKVLIIDDVLSAGTAGRESIKSILSLDAVPTSFIVGLNRQEKGQFEVSSSEELKNEFNLTVESIINLDTLIAFVENESDYSNYLSQLNEYRETWSA